MTRDEVIEKMARGMRLRLASDWDNLSAAAQDAYRDDARCALEWLIAITPGLSGLLEGTHVAVPRDAMIVLAIAERDAAIARLDVAAEWFQQYADSHTAKGDADKAKRNQDRADYCRAMIAAQEQP